MTSCSLWCHLPSGVVAVRACTVRGVDHIYWEDKQLLTSRHRRQLSITRLSGISPTFDLRLQHTLFIPAPWTCPSVISLHVCGHMPKTVCAREDESLCGKSAPQNRTFPVVAHKYEHQHLFNFSLIIYFTHASQDQPIWSKLNKQEWISECFLKYILNMPYAWTLTGQRSRREFILIIIKVIDDRWVTGVWMLAFKRLSSDAS